MNLIKKKSFWFALLILVLVLFVWGWFFAPNTVTTCMPGFCDNEWGTTPDYRASVGLLFITIGVLPAIILSLILSYLINRKSK